MKNILFLGTSDFGGVSVYVSSLVKRIHEFEFFIPCSKENDNAKLNNLFPNAKFIEFSNNYSFISLWKSLNSLNKIIKINKIHLIHAHTLRAGALAALYKLCFNINLTLIYTGHGLRYTQKTTTFAKLIFKGIECFTNRLSDKVVFIRESEFNIAKNQKIVSLSKAYYIRTQINREVNNLSLIDIRTHFHINTPYIIANAASIYDLKNPDLFIQIARHILKTRNDITFIWFGDGVLRSNLTEMLVHDGLADRILFVGAFDQNYMHQAFQQINALLLTSKIETFPLVVLESYLSQTLVFCSNFSGVNEIVKDKVTGFIFDMNNSLDAAQLIIENLLDVNHSKQIKINAYDFYNKSFNDIDKFVEQHIQLYKIKN